MNEEKIDLINRFKSLVESGDIKPSHYSLLKVDSILASKIDRVFKKWNDFIEACGYKRNKPKAIFTERKQEWSEEKIKEYILEIRSRGERLNYTNIRKHHSKLLCAATYRFNDWENALKCCGLDPSKIVRAHAFSKEEVVGKVLELYKENQNITSSHIDKTNPLLFRSAIKHFRNWTNLLKFLNIQKRVIVEKKQHEQKWNKEKVVQAIIAIHKSGQRINSTYVSSSLNNAGRRYFGSWDAAITAAGFSVEKVKEYKGKKPIGRRSKLTPEIILEIIKKRHDEGQSLYCNDVSSTTLCARSKKLFGSWKKAVEAAGLVYKKQNYKCLGEDVCYHLLKSFFKEEEIFRHYGDFDWVRKYCGVNTHFDFYIPALNLLVEFQGPTHFTPVYGLKEFAKQRVRDNRKRELTKKYGIKLLEIKYDELLPLLVSEQLERIEVPHTFSNTKIGLCNYYLKKLRKYSQKSKEHRKCLS